MLFADSGSATFDAAFRAALRQACPELGWADIPNDDIIYQQPFEFPNGVPALFHHAGDRASGLKYNDRWIAFYHSGDLGDAWRNDRAGMSDAVAQRAFKLGVNIMNYAFNMYTDLHSAPVPAPRFAGASTHDRISRSKADGRCGSSRQPR